MATRSAHHIELHIDELVLHGFAAADRYRIAEALGNELQRLLVEGSLPHRLSSGQQLAEVKGGSFEVSPAARPETIGAQVAQAVYRGLKA